MSARTIDPDVIAAQADQEQTLQHTGAVVYAVRLCQLLREAGWVASAGFDATTLTLTLRRRDERRPAGLTIEVDRCGRLDLDGVLLMMESYSDPVSGARALVELIR